MSSIKLTNITGQPMAFNVAVDEDRKGKIVMGEIKFKAKESKMLPKKVAEDIMALCPNIKLATEITRGKKERAEYYKRRNQLIELKKKIDNAK